MIQRVRMARKRLMVARERAKAAIRRREPGASREQVRRRMNHLRCVVRRKEPLA